jgi:hypothetical protein
MLRLFCILLVGLVSAGCMVTKPNNFLVTKSEVTEKFDEIVCRNAKYNTANRARLLYKEEAKRRGLDCGVGITQTTSASSAANSNTSNDNLCNRATRDGHWETGLYHTPFVKEAKRRGLSCGVGETTQTASAPVPKAKPQVTSAALTASQKEAESLRQRVAALEADKTKQQQTISSDTKLPTITIASADTKGKQGVIRGRANDNTGIAEITVSGQPVPFDAAGNFQYQTFVPTGGKDIAIEVTDLTGLTSKQTVSLTRSAAAATAVITFDSLNPLGRRVTKNSDALALIIGVDGYENTPARAIYADSDAQMFADYATEKLGIPANRIKTLLMTLCGNPESIESVLGLYLHHLATQVSVNLMIAV